MPLMSLTWHTRDDERVCPICMPLDGHTWVFDTEKEPFPDVLIDPRTNLVVWDCVRDDRRPHGHGRFNCRCWLTESWDFVDIESRLASIKTRALEACGRIEIWSGGVQMQVLRSHGRFVSWRKTI